MSRYPIEHLLVLPLPFQRRGDTLLVESQAANGLRLWAEHFQPTAIAAPVIDADHPKVKVHDWIPLKDHPSREHLEFVPLGSAKDRARAAELAKNLIRRSRYLQFAVGGSRHDWAALFAEVALGMGRPYAIHMDLVEHVALRRMRGRFGALSRLKLRIESELLRRRHLRLIRASALMLCHGNDVYEAFGHESPEAHLIHDLHVPDEAILNDEQVQRKVAALVERPYLQVCYAGRMESQKAPDQWVRAIAEARQRGADIRATWLGDGSQFEQVRQLVQQLDLESVITLAGFVSDRTRVLNTIASADVLLFTHLVPESPRCLLEALISASPIVGYDSAFPRDLIKEHQGGRLVKLGDWQALGAALAELANNRSALPDLVQRAARDGRQFSSANVFAHRADLIRQMPAGEA